MFSCIRLLLFTAVAAALVSCAGTKVDSELANLEKPPRMVDFSTYNQTYPSHSNAEQQASEETEKRENFDVLLTDKSGRNTTLTIVQPYDRAWARVAKALNGKAFDVSDRDRDSGMFYVSYDPDYEQSGWEKAASFFTGGSEMENDYKLKLTDNETVTEITAELIADDAFDEGNYSDPDTEVEKFLTALYKILRKQKL